MNDKQMEMMAREHDMTGVNEEAAEEVVQAAANGAKTVYYKIEDAVVSGYKKIEGGVVSGYKKIEDGAVEGFNKVNDKIIEKVFSMDGETLEETKKRLSGDK